MARATACGMALLQPVSVLVSGLFPVDVHTFPDDPVIACEVPPAYSSMSRCSRSFISRGLTPSNSDPRRSGENARAISTRIWAIVPADSCEGIGALPLRM